MTETPPPGDAEVHLSGPDDGGWHHTVTRDWIPVCPQIGPTAFRLYAITRSLVIDKLGSVRKLTLNELCQLLPGRNGKPSSVGRVRDAIRELSAVGLYTTPEGAPVTTSSSKNAAARPMRIRINDFPKDPSTYEGPRNAFAVLEAIRSRAEVPAGQKSNQVDGTGWKTNQAGQKSNHSGWESNPEIGLTSGNAACKEDLEGRFRKEEGEGDGRRPPTGSGAERGGGFAASDKTKPLPHKASPASIRAVLQSIPTPLMDLLANDWPRGLPSDVTDLISRALTTEQRTVAQVAERIARRWQVFGYENAALSNADEGLRTGLGVLEELLAPSKCWGNNLDCEDGADINTGAACPRCEEERAARRPQPERQETAPASEAKTYTAPAYVPHAREGAVGVNEDLAQRARAILLAGRTTRRR